VDCGYRNFPPTALCPGCLSERVRREQLSPRGTLYSWTTNRVGEADAFVGYVDLPEGLRVFARILLAADTSQPQCGMSVRLKEAEAVIGKPHFTFEAAAAGGEA
jgi:uncharacterized OB-fold protein